MRTELAPTHDVHHVSHIVDTFFEESSEIEEGKNRAVMAGVQMLEKTQYWRDENKLDNWWDQWETDHR